MFGPALYAWEAQNVGFARFDVDNGNLVLEHLDTRTGIIKLNPEWLRAQGFGHHVEDDSATIRIGQHVFRRVPAAPRAVRRLRADHRTCGMDVDMRWPNVPARRGQVMKAWLIPSLDYAQTLGAPNSRGRYRFGASMKDNTNDRWRPYRLDAEQLPTTILSRLDALSTDHR
jgi:hypothetical protein